MASANITLSYTLSFNKRANIVDLTLEDDSKINTENPVYLIDKRLLDTLLAKVTLVNLEYLKEKLIKEVTDSITKEEIFKRLDDFIYLDKIVNHPNFVKENNQEESIDLRKSVLSSED